MTLDSFGDIPKMSIELHPRPDRDEYVDIHWDNIIPDTQTSCYSCNFRKEDASDVMNYGPYDYGSVMHYEWYAFQKQGGLKTISGKVEKNPEILEVDRDQDCLSFRNATALARERE